MSWSSTFSRFRSGSLPLAGPIVVRVVDWTKPRTGIAPVFERPPFLERFSVAHPALLFVVFFPVGAFGVWRGWADGYTVVEVISAYLLGLLIWSGSEYAFHRGSFHHEPHTETQVAYMYMMHGCHHAYPDDSRRWVMPLVVSVPLSSAIYLVMRAFTGPAANPIFGGFIHGYLLYDLLHYFIHRGHLPTRLGRFLRQYHLAHHYTKPDGHYGVTSPLWDVVFRTR